MRILLQRHFTNTSAVEILEQRGDTQLATRHQVSASSVFQAITADSVRT